jgi:hypothetical protein
MGSQGKHVRVLFLVDAPQRALTEHDSFQWKALLPRTCSSLEGQAAVTAVLVDEPPHLLDWRTRCSGLQREESTMKRELKRLALVALCGGGMLVACGNPLEQGAMAPWEGTLGTQQSALCAGTSVSSLTLDGLDSWGGLMAGSGTWEVSGGANAARMEYWVDGVLSSFGIRTADPGTSSGAWSFSANGVSCGNHTVQVKAYPMIIDSANNQETCLAHLSSLPTQTVTQSCPATTLSCSRSSSTAIACTGSAGGGAGGPYAALWQQTTIDNGTVSTTPWTQGTLTRSFFCARPSGRDSFVQRVIRFKARDSSGMESSVQIDTEQCAP